jgi:hypothetical protein
MVVTKVMVAWFAARAVALVVTPVGIVILQREPVARVAVAAVRVKTLPDLAAVKVVVPQPALVVGVAIVPRVNEGRVMAIVSVAARGRELRNEKRKLTAVSAPTRPGDETPPRITSVAARVVYTAGDVVTGTAPAAVLLIVVIKVLVARFAACTVVPVVMPVAIVTVHVELAASVAVPAVRVRVVPDLVAGKVVVPQPEE